MLKKISALILICIIVVSGVIYCGATNEPNYEWATEGVNYCRLHRIMTGDENGNLNLGDNLTRAQMAKILVETFKINADNTCSFSDVEGHWGYDYIRKIENYMPKRSTKFNPDEYVTREEFAATLVRASGLTTGNIRNRKILDVNFADAYQVDADYKTLLSIAVERAYMKGSEGCILPKNLLVRAEVAVFIQRVAENNAGTKVLGPYDLGVKQSWTAMKGEAQISAEQAARWARACGATDKFVEAAPIYWQYGKEFGIRPEILYAQSAKETGYGKYGGAVVPEMNNWAGIKIKSPIGDRMEDHESFATPEDGVRAHFNHMCAYLGIQPIGEVHDRYYVVKTISWAGTVNYLEELGGKWCPDLYYGYSVLHDCLEEMMKY